ncbi:MAG: biopolymer transporter ExbD, partial [Halioglobus sp.]|nr:biopolymer transporter ExbD [Halioglobus sp.]
DEDSPTSADEIVRRAQILIAQHPDIPVLVKGDRAVPYGNVIGAMVLLQRAGAETVGFVTDPLDTYPVPE